MNITGANCIKKFKCDMSFVWEPVRTSVCVLNVDDGSLLNDEAPSHVASLLMQISRFRSGHVLYN